MLELQRVKGTELNENSVQTPSTERQEEGYEGDGGRRLEMNVAFREIN